VYLLDRRTVRACIAAEEQRRDRTLIGLMPQAAL
jgi:hypothetical protein